MENISPFSTNSLSEISFIGGTYRELAFDVVYPSGSPVNLNAFTSCQWILSPFGQPEVATILKQGIVDTLKTNRFWVYLSSDDTVSLSGKFVQQPVIVASTGYEFRIGQGYLNIIPASGFASISDGQTFTQQLINISGSIASFESQVSGSIVTFENLVSGSIASFKTLVSGSIATFETLVSGSISSFKAEVSGSLATMPLPASGSTLIAGTNNTQFATAKGLKDAGFVALDLISGSAFKQIWVSGFKPTLTNGVGASAQLEAATNKEVYDYLPFDPNALQESYVNIAMPSDYTGGSFYAKFYWTHPATTTNFNVMWGCHASSFANAENLDLAIGGGGEILDTGGTTSYLYISDLTPAFSPSGTPAAGELVHMRAYRYGSHASDTMAVNAYLIGVMLWYPVA